MANVITAPAPNSLAALKSKQQAVWSSGDYAIVGTTLQIVFRASGASTAAIHGSDNPHLASALLHHTHPNVTNAHYNRATNLSAAENFRQIVRQYGKK